MCHSVSHHLFMLLTNFMLLQELWPCWKDCGASCASAWQSIGTTASTQFWGVEGVCDPNVAGLRTFYALWSSAYVQGSSTSKGCTYPGTYIWCLEACLLTDLPTLLEWHCSSWLNNTSFWILLCQVTCCPLFLPHEIWHNCTSANEIWNGNVCTALVMFKVIEVMCVSPHIVKVCNLTV